MANGHTEAPGLGLSFIQWSAVFAGATVAAALAIVMHTFAGAIGLAVSSTAPTWRDASFALWLLSGLYLIFVALIAYGVGGYVAGRLRARLVGGTADEVEVRDGSHGMFTWGVATLLTGLMLAFAAPVADRLAAPSGGETGPSASVGGESIFAYDLDRLFRSDPPVEGTELEYNRAEAGRILLAAAGHSGMTAEDREHLVRLVATQTGLSAAEAEVRVDTVVAGARENVARGRRATVILAFMTGVAAILGLAVAWFAAVAGGQHRDGTAPSLWYPSAVRKRAETDVPLP